MSEDKLLTVFEKVNIEVGKVPPHVIKGWFDTDCGDLLKWICTSITEDCCISAQEESEYRHIEKLSSEQLNKKVKSIEGKYPGLFDTQSNRFDIEIATDKIEMLEEESRDLEQEMQANQQLQQNLLAELSKVTAEEIQYQIEEESALDECTLLSDELDKINAQTYDQIMKYSFYLGNYEFQAEFPVFANNVDIMEFEETFQDIANTLKSITKIDSDLLEISDGKYVTDTLSEIEFRIFNSRISQLALQMEIEALNSTLKFLETYDTNSSLFFIDFESIQLSIKLNKDQQSCMLKVMEEIALKLAGQCVNQPTQRCLKNESEFFHLKLNYLNKFKEDFVKILQLFVIMHTLYLQETIDINHSRQFFKNAHKYINKDLKLSKFRKEAMLKVISQYEDFCLLPIEKKFKLVGDFATVALKNKTRFLGEIVENATSLRSVAGKVQKQLCRSIGTDVNTVKQLHNSIQVLRDFLVCGPTSQIVIVPISLQLLLFEVDKNILDQSSCVKFLIQAAQEPKDIFAKDKWLRHQDQLWTFFMTDSTKVLSYLEQLKFRENHIEEKNHVNSNTMLI